MQLNEMTYATAINELDELRIRYEGSPNPSIFEIHIRDNEVYFTKCGWNGDIFPTNYKVPVGTSIYDTIKEIVKESSLHLVTAEAWVRSTKWGGGFNHKDLGRMLTNNTTFEV